MTPLEQAAVLIAESLDIKPGVVMTGEQAAEFREHFEAALAEAHHHLVPRVLPPLSEPEVRQLLRECVTVVKPGETLIIRGDRNWTPGQLREVQDWLDREPEWRGLDFRILVVPGEELGVAEPRGVESRHVGVSCDPGGSCGCAPAEPQP